MPKGRWTRRSEVNSIYPKFHLTPDGEEGYIALTITGPQGLDQFPPDETIYEATIEGFGLNYSKFWVKQSDDMLIFNVNGLIEVVLWTYWGQEDITFEDMTDPLYPGITFADHP